MNLENLSVFEQLDKLRITANSNIPQHDFLFEWNGTPCFARAELVAVTGKAKSGKTYLSSILMAAAVTKQNSIGIQRRAEDPLKVVWIDTEQSNDTTCEILRDRIGPMIGATPDNDTFHVFNLRPVAWRNRMTLVLSIIALCKPDLVILDGIRDVVGDINSYEEAQNIIETLLKIASEYNTCIVCVLHQNKAMEDRTLRGAIGTELQNKSFETYECSKNADTHIFSIKQTATRKYDLPRRIDFAIAQNGLPVPCYAPEDNNACDIAEIFGTVLAGHGELRAGVLKTQVKMRFRITSDTDYGAMLMEAVRQGIIVRREVSDREVYYQPGPALIQPKLDFGG